jgi:hypothetical protein
VLTEGLVVFVFGGDRNAAAPSPGRPLYVGVRVTVRASPEFGPAAIGMIARSSYETDLASRGLHRHSRHRAVWIDSGADPSRLRPAQECALATLAKLLPVGTLAMIT